MGMLDTNADPPGLTDGEYEMVKRVLDELVVGRMRPSHAFQAKLIAVAIIIQDMIALLGFDAAIDHIERMARGLRAEGKERGDMIHQAFKDHVSLSRDLSNMPTVEEK